MKMISTADRERLRDLAYRHLEYATCSQNDAILNKWQALAEGRRKRQLSGFCFLISPMK